jgi:hypothetical protein
MDPSFIQEELMEVTMADKRTKKRAIGMAFCACVVLAFALAALAPAGWSIPRNAEKEPYDDGGYLYTGALRGGKFNGHGKIVYDNGEAYEGGFAAGQFEGNGIFTSNAGWRFEGKFHEGILLSGVFKDESGTVKVDQHISHYVRPAQWSYTGPLGQNGQYGVGKFVFFDGAVYQGGFADGLANGNGSYTDAAGRLVYQGAWMNGRFEGKGTYHAPDGSFLYEGAFGGGKFNGEGTLTKKDGTALSGTWKNGWRVKKP